MLFSNIPLKAYSIIVLLGLLSACHDGDDGKDGRDGADGINTFTVLTDEPPGDNCPNGGQKIETTVEQSNNGLMRISQVQETTFICNGIDGEDGKDGAPGLDGSDGLNSLIKVTVEPPGPTCPTGGQKIQMGLDKNKNGILDGAEIQKTIFHCNPDAPAATSLTLDYEPVKTFAFSWTEVVDPFLTHYRLLENPDGMSGFSLVATIPAGIENYDLVVPLYARVNAHYIVESCNAFGCTSSPEVLVSAPLFVDSIGYFKASNTGANDAFGGAVSLSADGHTLVVGADGEDSDATGIDGDQSDNSAGAAGAVYVFTRSGSTWSQQAYIKASNTNPDDKFGHALSLSADGDTLAVGANWENSAATGINGDESDNSANDAGAVYVFTRSSGTWTQQAYIKASNTNAGDEFGHALSLNANGDTLAVGARLENSAATGINGDQSDNTAANAGAVYVFTRSGSTWSQQAYIKASNTGDGDQFGDALSLSADGDTLAVGAREENSAATGIDGDQSDNSANDAGAVYIFTRSGSTWSQQAYIKASNTDIGDEFGNALSLSTDGNTLAVGAFRENSIAIGIGGNQSDNSANDAGAVYVFTRNMGVWSQQAYIKASNTGGGDLFGNAVTLSADGDTLAVGARLEDSAATGIDGDQSDNTASSSGAIYVFTRSGNTWSQQAYVKASNTAQFDLFGLGLSADGNTLAAGATAEDSSATGINGDQSDNSANASGAVYLY